MSVDLNRKDFYAMWDWLQGKGEPQLKTDWGRSWFDKLVAETGDKDKFFRFIIRDFHNLLLIETNKDLAEMDIALAKMKLEGMPKDPA